MGVINIWHHPCLQWQHIWLLSSLEIQLWDLTATQGWRTPVRWLQCTDPVLADGCLPRFSLPLKIDMSSISTYCFSRFCSWKQEAPENLVLSSPRGPCNLNWRSQHSSGCTLKQISDACPRGPGPLPAVICPVALSLHLSGLGFLAVLLTFDICFWDLWQLITFLCSFGPSQFWWSALWCVHALI